VEKWPAVIASLAALGGAAIGSVSGELVRGHIQDERDERLARGAARLLFDEYYSSGIYLQVILEAHRILPVDRKFTIELSQGDERLIASHLTGQEWNEVALANGLIEQTILILRERHRTRAGSPLDARDIRVIQATLDQVMRARSSLAGLAGVDADRR